MEFGHTSNYKTMKSKIMECPNCNSISTLPIAYGLISDKGHQQNNSNKELQSEIVKMNSREAKEDMKNLLLKFKKSLTNLFF